MATELPGRSSQIHRSGFRGVKVNLVSPPTGTGIIRVEEAQQGRRRAPRPLPSDPLAQLRSESAQVPIPDPEQVRGGAVGQEDATDHQLAREQERRCATLPSTC